MLRVRIISNIAVALDYLSKKKRNKFVEEYKNEIETNPRLLFLEWIKGKRILNSEQLEILERRYLNSRLQCKRCEHEFAVKDTDYEKTLLCPNCGSEALAILVMRDGKYVQEDSKSISTATLDIDKTDPLFVGEDRNSDELYPNDIINKNLQIIVKVGQGGMGAVYKAKHLNLDVYRAVKVLGSKLTKNKEQEMRFLREARSAAGLDHQNIVKVHNVDNEDGRLYIEMEWVEGDSIQNMIKSRGALSLEEAVDYTIQAARGMSSAHRRGIIHRDIKPDNLMVTYEHVVKIADFGLAKPSESSTDLKISQSGTILGTPYYMSPEQAQNKELTAATDIYSLGVSFYHMLTGEVPYVGESAIQVLFQHIKSPFPSIRKKIANIPIEIDHLILRMTAKNPELRPPSLIEIIDELEAIREKYDIVPVRYTDLRAFSGKKRKFKTVAVRTKSRKAPKVLFLIIAFLFIVAGIGMLWWEFGNLSEIYDEYLKPYFEENSRNPIDDSEITKPPVDEVENVKDPKDDDLVQPTEDQVKIKRNKTAGRKFRALRDGFDGNDYTKYISDLRELHTEYSDTLTAPEVEEEIRLAIKNREIAAESWWIKNKSKYDQLIEDRLFADALNLLGKFPDDFAETELTKTIEEMKVGIKDDVKLELEAGVVYQEFLDFTKEKLLDTSQIERLEEIKKTIIKQYSKTRFIEFIDEIDEFIELAKKNFEAEQKRLLFEKNKKVYEVIEQNFEGFIKESNFQEAIDYLNERKLNFDEDSNWRKKIDELINAAQSQVQKLYDEAIKKAETLANEDKFLGAEGAEGTLKSVMTWGLTSMKDEASKLLQEYYHKYIISNLDMFEELKKYKTGITFCESLLKDMKFSKHFKYIIYRQKELALFDQGFVKIVTNKVTPLEDESFKSMKWDVETFYISKFEITNRQFQEFVNANGYNSPEYWSKDGWELKAEGKFRYAGGANAPKSWGGSQCPEDMLDQPVTGISYFEAEAFCYYKDWKLPTIQQWLVASGWDEKNRSWRAYPWGDEVTEGEKLTNIGSESDRGKVANVGTYARDVSFFGLYDCAGNVREWILSRTSDNATVLGGHFLQTHLKEDGKIIKSTQISKTQRESYTGFRCAVVLEKPESD